MLTKHSLLAGVGLVATAAANFNLTTPTAIETTGGGTIPCGKYDALDRTVVSEWPVLGHDVGIDTEDQFSTFSISAALVDDLDHQVALRPPVHHRRKGDFCFMRIRGVEDWVGKQAVVEVKQYTGNRQYTFRCAAVTFVEGGPAPPGCRGFHEQLVTHHQVRLEQMATGNNPRHEKRDVADQVATSRIGNENSFDDLDGLDEAEMDDLRHDIDDLHRRYKPGPADTLLKLEGVIRQDESRPEDIRHHLDVMLVHHEDHLEDLLADHELRRQEPHRPGPRPEDTDLDGPDGQDGQDHKHVFARTSEEDADEYDDDQLTVPSRPTPIATVIPTEARNAGEGYAYGTHPSWPGNTTAPLPTGHGHADQPGEPVPKPAPGPEGSHPLTPVPVSGSKACGFSKGLVMLNLGLIGSMVALLSL